MYEYNPILKIGTQNSEFFDEVAPERGDFTVGASSKRAAKDYQRSADPVAAFLRGRVRPDADGFVLRSALYEAYAQLCRANKNTAPTRIEFNGHVRELLGETVEERRKKKRGMAWLGIKLRAASL